jgi:hypothetical protein
MISGRELNKVERRTFDSSDLGSEGFFKRV